MIKIKTPEDIEKMKKGGKILAKTLDEIIKNLKPGASEEQINNLAEEIILQKGGYPAFKKVEGYSHGLCISTNDVIVHGIPGKYIFKEGDVVGIDCGVFFDGFNTDMAETIRVLDQKSEIKNKKDNIDMFLEEGKRALREAMAQAKPGNRIGHISKKIQEIIEGSGYSVVRVLVGHGVGEKLHEEPEVPGFLDKSIDKTPLLKEGMTIAIEVIYNMGKKEVLYGRDGWTIKTKDNSLSGLFERTVAVTKEGPVILTK